MTLNQMKYFIAVARCLSFTEAARSLFMTQPALSRQIQAMEEEVGTRLFVRDKKTLKLTPGGVVLYNGLPDLLKRYEGMITDARNANRGFRGRLRIGVLDVYDISDLFPPVVDRFQEKYPDIRLSLERFSLGELPERLYQDELDLICTYGFSLFDKPDLVTEDVQKYDSCIMLSREHPLAYAEGLSLEDLRQERFVQLGRWVSEEGYQYIANLLNRSGVHGEIVQVNKMEDVLLWVQMGRGVAVTTNRSIEKFNPHVVIRELTTPDVKGHDITMAWRRGNYNPAISMFMEMVDECIREHGPEDGKRGN